MEPFAATSSEPASSSDLFATSPPALEKDVKTQAKKVLSLFEEEEERLEDDDGIKNAQKEIGVVSLGKLLNTGKQYFCLHYSRRAFVLTLPSLHVMEANLLFLNFHILGLEIIAALPHNPEFLCNFFFYIPLTQKHLLHVSMKKKKKSVQTFWCSYLMSAVQN